MENLTPDQVVMTKADFDASLKTAADRATAKARKEPALPAHMQAANKGPEAIARDEKLAQENVVRRFLLANYKVGRSEKKYEEGARELENLQTEYPEWYQAKTYKAVGDNSVDWSDVKVDKAAFSEASNGAGLFTVPTFWADRIYNLVPSFGFVQRLADNFPMPAYAVQLSTGGAVSVSWPGNNTGPSAFDATGFFTQTTLTANTMAVTQIIQRELLQDTSVPIMGYIAKQVAIAVAREQDYQFFNGAASPFTGLTGLSGTTVTFQGGSAGSGKTSNTNISWTDLVNLPTSVSTAALNGAAYFGTQATYAALRKEASASRPIWDFANPPQMAGQQGVYPLVGGQAVPTNIQGGWMPNGFPFFVIDGSVDLNGHYVMPIASSANTTSVIFGNLQNGTLGIRQELVMETYDQYAGGQELSGTRQIALVSYMRMGIAFPLPSAFGILKTSVS